MIKSKRGQAGAVWPFFMVVTGRFKRGLYYAKSRIRANRVANSPINHEEDISMTEFLLKSDIDEICQRLAIQAKDFSGKTVLLTGGRGFLGRYFMDIFARLNETVLDEPVNLVALDNLITAGKEGADRKSVV